MGIALNIEGIFTWLVALTLHFSLAVGKKMDHSQDTHMPSSSTLKKTALVDLIVLS